jgi:hypothetical protein
MHRVYLPLLFFSFIASTFGDNARFFRLLQNYENPRYQAEHRFIFGDFSYDADRADNRPETMAFDYAGDGRSFYSKVATGHLGIQNEQLFEMPLVLQATKLNAKINGDYRDVANATYNNMINAGDTMGDRNYQLGLDGTYDWNVERYHERAKKKMPIAYGFFMNVLSNNYYQIKRTFSHKTLSDTIFTINGTKQIDSKINFSIEPNFGWGKPVAITPLLKALAIERSLKVSGALSADLPDATILRIADWIASEKKYDLPHDLHEKFFYAKIDSIMKKDSIVVNLNPFFSYKIAEDVHRYVPELRKGVQLFFSLKSRMLFGFEYEEYLYQNTEGLKPFSSPISETGLDAFYLSFYWGIPFTQQLFGTLSGRCKPLLIAAFDDAGASSKPLFSIESIQALWQADLNYLVTDRIFIQASIRDIPAWLIAPHAAPSTVYFEATYFLEDQLSLKATWGKLFKRPQSPLPWEHSFDDAADAISQDYFSLGASYAF